MLQLEFEFNIATDAMHYITYHEKNSTSNINETTKKKIKKIRDIVKLFKKSSLKYGILQGCVKAGFGCEKLFCLDTKTYWNSLVTMLDGFLGDKISNFKSTN